MNQHTNNMNQNQNNINQNQSNMIQNQNNIIQNQSNMKKSQYNIINLTLKTNTNQRLIVKDPKVNMLELQLNPTDLVGTINCQMTKTMEDPYFKNYLAENLDT